MPDLDALADDLEASIAELAAAAPSTGGSEPDESSRREPRLQAKPEQKV
jgi:hypothetical protein